MELGMVGLGRMGGNMAQRLLTGGHHIVAFDPQPLAVKAAEGNGADVASSLMNSCRNSRLPKRCG